MLRLPASCPSTLTTDRREFLTRSGLGFGSLALASLLDAESGKQSRAAGPATPVANPLAAQSSMCTARVLSTLR